MGCRRPPDPGHPPRRCHPGLHLQPVRPRHRRTRRARPHYPLRIRRQPASGQPPHQPGWQPVTLSLRQRGPAAH
nr:hypothetical protein [Pseudomonas sp. ITA]